jgi:hypothetical protein
VGRPAEGIDPIFLPEACPFGFGEVEDLDELKGGGSRPSGSERFRILRTRREAKADPFGFGEVEDLDELKGGGSRPSGSERFRILRTRREASAGLRC